MSSEPREADLIDRLARYGLGQGEARCYTAMLAQRASRVSEVAQRAGVPRSRSYELIRSLIRAGLCSEVAGSRVARFRAVPPNEAIGRLEAFLGERERRRNAALSSLLHALDSRESGGGRGADDEPVRTLRRRDQVFGAYERLLSDSREEIVAVLAMPWKPVLRPNPTERLAAGVRIRAVHESEVCSTSPQREWVSFYCDRGVDTRVVDEAPAQFSVFDGRRSILHLTMPGAGTHHLESVLIDDAGFGQTLRQAFECLWDRGIPFGQGLRQAGGPALPGAQRHPRQLPWRGREGRFVGDD